MGAMKKKSMHMNNVLLVMCIVISGFPLVPPDVVMRVGATNENLLQEQLPVSPVNTNITLGQLMRRGCFRYTIHTLIEQSSDN